MYCKTSLSTAVPFIFVSVLLAFPLCLHGPFNVPIGSRDSLLHVPPVVHRWVMQVITPWFGAVGDCVIKISHCASTTVCFWSLEIREIPPINRASRGMKSSQGCIHQCCTKASQWNMQETGTIFFFPDGCVSTVRAVTLLSALTKQQEMQRILHGWQLYRPIRYKNERQIFSSLPESADIMAIQRLSSTETINWSDPKIESAGFPSR